MQVWINPNPILKEGQWQNLDLNVNATEPYAGESVSVDLAIGNRVVGYLPACSLLTCLCAYGQGLQSSVCGDKEYAACLQSAHYDIFKTHYPATCVLSSSFPAETQDAHTSHVPWYSQSETRCGLVLAACMQLRLYVWQDSWETSWRGPVIVAVVVLSVLCSLLIFSVLLSW